MIRHNLPGFLAGPMPVPGWPESDPNYFKTRPLEWMLSVREIMGPLRKKNFQCRVLFDLAKKKKLKLVMKPVMRSSLYIDWHNKLVRRTIS